MNLRADKMTIFPTFSIYKCTCGKAFQRERFHKHRQGLPEKEGQFHQRKDFILFCPSCNKCTRNKAEFGDHTDCPYVSLSKPNMDCVLAGKAIPNLAGVIAKAAENKAKASARGEQDPIEAAVRASEIDQAILTITPQPGNAPNAAEGSSSDGSESDFPALNTGRRNQKRVSTLTGSSSDEEREFRPSGCSSPKRSRAAVPRVGLRLQQSCSRAEASHPSQAVAIVSLTDSLKRAEAARLAAVKEVEFLKAKDLNFHRMEAQSKADREEVTKLRREEEEKKKKIASLEEELRKERVAREKVEGELRVARRKLEAAAEKAQQGEAVHLLGHIACKQGRLTHERRWEQLDNDETTACFITSDTACHHLFITSKDPLTSVKMKNVRPPGS